MDKHRLSIGSVDSFNLSRGESELDRLRSEMKEKQTIIDEKSAIINGLRLRVKDWEETNAESEKAEQLLNQKVIRLEKEIGVKNEELESISHALKEVESANETLTKRLNGRTIQVQKFVEDLANTRRELEELRSNDEQLKHKNELLTIELETTVSRKKLLRERDESEAFSLEIQDLNNQIMLLKQQNINLTNESQKYLQQLKHHQEQHEKIRHSKELDNLKMKIAKLDEHNQQLLAEIKNLTAATKKHSLSTSDQEQSYEELIQELYDLRAKVKSLSHRQSRRSIDEEIMKLKQELEVTETSWKLERQHKERYAKENINLERKVHEMSKELNNLRLFKEQESMGPPPPPLPPKNYAPKLQDENMIPDTSTSAIHFSMADEVGSIMDSNSVGSLVAREKKFLNESTVLDQHLSNRTTLNMNDSLKIVNLQKQQSVNNYCHDHRIRKSSFYSDPMAEQKMRLERAKELARRNMKTKPLHQTSYPLELDTFDTTNLTEKEIKSGNVMRPALADFSNQKKQPVVNRKAEAFIV